MSKWIQHYFTAFHQSYYYLLSRWVCLFRFNIFTWHVLTTGTHRRGQGRQSERFKFHAKTAVTTLVELLVVKFTLSQDANCFWPASGSITTTIRQRLSHDIHCDISTTFFPRHFATMCDYLISYRSRSQQSRCQSTWLYPTILSQWICWQYATTVWNETNLASLVPFYCTRETALHTSSPSYSIDIAVNLSSWQTPTVLMK